MRCLHSEFFSFSHSLALHLLYIYIYSYVILFSFPSLALSIPFPLHIPFCCALSYGSFSLMLSAYYRLFILFIYLVSVLRIFKEQTRNK